MRLSAVFFSFFFFCCQPEGKRYFGCNANRGNMHACRAVVAAAADAVVNSAYHAPFKFTTHWSLQMSEIEHIIGHSSLRLNWRTANYTTSTFLLPSTVSISFVCCMDDVWVCVFMCWSKRVSQGISTMFGHQADDNVNCNTMHGRRCRNSIHDISYVISKIVQNQIYFNFVCVLSAGDLMRLLA